jgi:hypothetical protein
MVATKKAEKKKAPAKKPGDEIPGRSRNTIEREHHELTTEVVKIFQAANFEIKQSPPRGRSPLGDFWAQREELKKPRVYAIEVKTRLTFRDANQQRQRLRHYTRNSKVPFEDFNEFWVVAQRVDPNARAISGEFGLQFRVVDIAELRSIFAVPKPPRSRPSKATTKIGKAVEANEKEITLAISALILQIDAKLEALSSERLNSDEGQARVVQETTDFERMKAELERIQDMVAAFKKDKAPEKEKAVVKATKTFKQGVEEWWTNKSGEILTSTAKGAVLVSSIALLALMKADSVAAITAVATVVNGGAIQRAKQIGSAVKRIAKRALASEDDGAVQ